LKTVRDFSKIPTDLKLPLLGLPVKTNKSTIRPKITSGHREIQKEKICEILVSEKDFELKIWIFAFCH